MTDGKRFDPMQHRGEASGDDAGRLDAAGDYLLAIPRFSRGTSNKGKSFLLCKIAVIDGKMKARSFLDRVYLNEEALWRLGQLCQAIGHEEAFDLTDDREVRAAIVNRPFKGRVIIEQQGDKRYARLDYLYFRVSDEEAAVMDEWVANRTAEGAYDDAPADDNIPF